MAKGRVDPLDLLAMPIFILGSLVSLGFISGFVILGFDPAATLVTLPGQTAISVSNLISIAALGFVIYTNGPEWSLDGGFQVWMFWVGVGLIVSPPFIPMIDAILGGTVAAFFAFIVQSFSYTYASYLG